jgi:hypothetical protein
VAGRRSHRIVALLAGLVLAVLASGALAAEASAYDLLVSSSADRSAASPLLGKALNGNIYVFVSPESGINQVRFYLDDPNRTRSPIKTENSAPWDFAGTASGSARNALPYNTDNLADGQHTITAAVTKSAGGTDVITASFTVSMTSGGGGCNPSPCSDSISVSKLPNRSNPVQLEGGTVSGYVYVFVPPASGVTRVLFYLDDSQRLGSPIKTEASAPWDFAGTASDSAKSANRYDTTKLANGQHTITAAITRSSGVSVVTSTFSVSNGGAPSPDLLPDLVADPPGNPRAPEVMRLADGLDHLLIKFSGYIHNIGAGAAELRGTNPVSGTMTVTGQRIYRQGGTFRDDTSRAPHIHFETNDGHNHWHLMNAARFSLWNQAGTAEVTPGAKVGFCFEDGEAADSFAVPNPAYRASATQRCREGQQAPANTFQGISSGWRDVYGSNVYFQWIDISNVAPGLYRLGSEMDTDNFVLESNESNNGPTLMSSTVTVPGYRASPVSAAVTGPQAITLAAQQFGTPGSRRFKIVSAPQHGTLSVATGTAFTGPQVTYTPAAGYTGPDSFTYAALDSASPYPLTPPTAQVTLGVT